MKKSNCCSVVLRYDDMIIEMLKDCTNISRLKDNSLSKFVR